MISKKYLGYLIDFLILFFILKCKNIDIYLINIILIEGILILKLKYSTGLPTIEIFRSM